jgi:hypothetical protein
MKNSTILSIIGISVCMLVIGAAIGSVVLRPSTSVSTKTVTTTSPNTVVEIVTRVSEVAPPPKLTISGTVDSEYYYPADVSICSRGKSIMVTNVTETVTGTVVTCGDYSAPVQNLTETSAGSNRTYNFYHGTYSMVLPNNESYFVQVNLHNLSSTTSFEQKVGYLALNYTESAAITDFDIFCSFSNGNLNSTFSCDITF